MSGSHSLRRRQNEERALFRAHSDGRRSQGRASGIIILRDGVILGGDPYFWSVALYTSGKADGREIW